MAPTPPVAALHTPLTTIGKSSGPRWSGITTRPANVSGHTSHAFALPRTRFPHRCPAHSPWSTPSPLQSPLPNVLDPQLRTCALIQSNRAPARPTSLLPPASPVPPEQPRGNSDRPTRCTECSRTEPTVTPNASNWSHTPSTPTCPWPVQPQCPAPSMLSQASTTLRDLGHPPLDVTEWPTQSPP